jgi:hypothetical protein
MEVAYLAWQSCLEGALKRSFICAQKEAVKEIYGAR